jgi:hypothetical protein
MDDYTDHLLGEILGERKIVATPSSLTPPRD